MTSKQICAALEDALNDAVAATQAVRGHTSEVSEDEGRDWLDTAMESIESLWMDYRRKRTEEQEIRFL